MAHSLHASLCPGLSCPARRCDTAGSASLCHSYMAGGPCAEASLRLSVCKMTCGPLCRAARTASSGMQSGRSGPRPLPCMLRAAGVWSSKGAVNMTAWCAPCACTLVMHTDPPTCRPQDYAGSAIAAGDAHAGHPQVCQWQIGHRSTAPCFPVSCTNWCCWAPAGPPDLLAVS